MRNLSDFFKNFLIVKLFFILLYCPYIRLQWFKTRVLYITKDEGLVFGGNHGSTRLYVKSFKVSWVFYNFKVFLINNFWFTFIYCTSRRLITSYAEVLPGIQEDLFRRQDCHLVLYKTSVTVSRSQNSLS